MIAGDFTSEEKKVLATLNTPEKIQRYIKERLEYNFEEDEKKVNSFRNVLKTGKADCLEGALFASAIMSFHGYPPLVVCMEGRDIDHNIALYKKDWRWGSIAQSRDKNLKGRKPVHRTIKDLVMSYYPYYWDYYSKNQDITNLSLRGYTKFSLKSFRENWTTSEKSVDFIVDFLWEAKYRFLFPRKDKSKFYKVDRKTNKVVFL